MTDEQSTPPAELEISKSALRQIALAQLRLALASIAGVLVAKGLMQPGLVTEQLLELGAGVIFLAGASAWAWVRAKFVHSKFFAIASDERVPDDVARIAD